jgi:hypothetical protein
VLGRLVILMIALYSYGCIIVFVVTALHNKGEYKMISKEQVDRIVDAIEGIGCVNDINTDHNFDLLINWIVEVNKNLEDISNTFKKIEAKMK